MSSMMADERQALNARPILKPASAGPAATLTSSSVTSSRPNYNSATIPFSINRSPPKGPRPAPSAYQARIEPARIPLPLDDVEGSLLAGSVSLERDQPNLMEFPSDVPSTAPLLSATSTSPPPFARNHLANSISSSSSQRSAPSLYSNDIDVQAITPDPWAPHATNTNMIGLTPQAPTVIDVKPNPVVMADEIQSLSNRLGVIGLTNEASDYNTLSRLADAKKGIQLDDTNNGKAEPANSARVSTNTSLQIPATVPAPNAILSPNATSDSLSPHSVPSSSASRSLIGSFDPSGSILSESVTWEKVDDIHDEWQELSNPHEDVLEVSESEDSDREGLEDVEADVDEEDEAEFEASRKVQTPSMVDSCFVPSVERRRRAAAAAGVGVPLKNGDSNGISTPRGKRTPTTSFAQNGGLRPGNACASEATSTYSKPRSAAPVSKLNPQQEQLVAELQRARTTKTIGGSAHQMMNRRAVPLSPDW